MFHSFTYFYIRIIGKIAPKILVCFDFSEGGDIPNR